ncbi:FtsW/RodA/SpoVE family cell cycle protein [Ignavigranum ruoffiae]|uniref:Probable peptidoglycan glycosyltransferase FtsW n=1 Tax=Ignavigranum ruoffiae TaxID=89093 RepID=A0A1H9ALH7_9LACT|nr:FtsW/RodA/SpoVE family cell cycle protein [Ignavigranum ruoffiae]SEP77233.1 cell division-specific peptidoglycan biosynthesis regulator FtsW [Ignavigranum ruoffiae]
MTSNHFYDETEHSPVRKHDRFTGYWSQFKTNFDWPIFFFMATLIIFGLVMVFSSTMFLPINGGPADPFSALWRQIAAVMAGLLLGVIAFVTPSRYYRNPVILLLAMTVIILLLLYTRFFGQEAFGAKSWIFLFGFSFQPSELTKVFAMLSIAWLSEYTSREVRLTQEAFRKFPIPNLLVVSLIITLALIFLQPDLGMLLIIALSLGFFWLIQKEKQGRNLIAYVACIVLFGVFYAFSSYFSTYLIQSGTHFLERLGIFVNPFADPSGVGYQLVNGYTAMSKGSWLGQGLGQGTMKYGQIPAINNDFILVNIIEELGFIGGIILLMIFLMFFMRLFRKAALMVDPYRSKVITGLALVLVIQTATNIGGVLGIIPLTGVTLPFISSGGSSIIISMVGVFLILKMIYIDNKEQAIQNK